MPFCFMYLIDKSQSLQGKPFADIQADLKNQLRNILNKPLPPGSMFVFYNHVTDLYEIYKIDQSVDINAQFQKIETYIDG